MDCLTEAIFSRGKSGRQSGAFGSTELEKHARQMARISLLRIYIHISFCVCVCVWNFVTRIEDFISFINFAEFNSSIL